MINFVEIFCRKIWLFSYNLMNHLWLIREVSMEYLWLFFINSSFHRERNQLLTEKRDQRKEIREKRSEKRDQRKEIRELTTENRQLLILYHCPLKNTIVLNVLMIMVISKKRLRCLM